MLPLLTIYFDLNLVFVFVCIIATTFIYLFYYFDKLKVNLPLCLRRLMSNSKYFLAEKFFAENNLFSSSEIKSNLANINKQLSKVKRNMRKCESYLFSLQAAGNSNDCLANEMLSLVITLKIFILNHNPERNGESGSGGGGGAGGACCATPAGNEPQLNNFQYLNDNEPDIKNKINTLDRRRLRNFHFINTLENLKLNLVKYRCVHLILFYFSPIKAYYLKTNNFMNFICLKFRSKFDFFVRTQKNYDQKIKIEISNRIRENF